MEVCADQGRPSEQAAFCGFGCQGFIGNSCGHFDMRRCQHAKQSGQGMLCIIIPAAPGRQTCVSAPAFSPLLGLGVYDDTCKQFLL